MIYVDTLTHVVAAQYHGDTQAKRVGARNGHQWCHLWCDEGEELELHAFAARIGMKRAWFQNKPGFPHYDLTPNRRVAAVKLGAVPTSLSDWLRARKGRTCSLVRSSTVRVDEDFWKAGK